MSINKRPFYISSTGSATISGLSVAGAVSAIVIVLELFGISFDGATLKEFVVEAGLAAGSVYAAFGILRKLYFIGVDLFNSAR